MPNIYSAVACSELSWTPEETGGVGDSPTAKAELLVAWELRWNLINDIFTNLRGWPHPGNLAGLPPKSASIKPYTNTAYSTASGDQISTYAHAVVAIQYGIGDTKVEKTEAGQLYSESLEPIIELLRQDHKNYSWINASGVEVGPVLENEAPSRPTYSMKFKRSLYKRDTIPAAVWTCMGKCNAAAYTSTTLGRTFEAQTLLLIPPKPKRTIKLDGTSTGFDIDLEFHWQESGWNKFFHPKTGEYLRFATRNSSGVLVPFLQVQTADFSGLWI